MFGVETGNVGDKGGGSVPLDDMIDSKMCGIVRKMLVMGRKGI